MEAVRPRAAKRGLETPLELWGYFVETCRRNLHVVLCFSPIGDAFRERLRANPSIVNCCTIDWQVPRTPLPSPLPLRPHIRTWRLARTVVPPS